MARVAGSCRRASKTGRWTSSGCSTERELSTTCATRHPIACTSSRATALGSTAFPSICNGVYASSGRTELLNVSRSSTTTNPDWLHNSHAGELLMSEFMEPLGLTARTLAAALEIEESRLQAVIDGSSRMDA